MSWGRLWYTRGISRRRCLPIETIRLSQKAKDQLITLKRATGIGHWNVLCRWAFCLSLAEPLPPPAIKVLSDSTLEMTWKTFAGDHPRLFLGLLIQRCMKDHVDIRDHHALYQHFRRHLDRGIGYLFSQIKERSDNISTLFKLAEVSARTQCSPPQKG
jgi:DNA sulfur modification protein DndE